MGALAVPAPRRAGDPEGSKKASGGTVGPLWTGLAAQEEVVDLEEAQKSCPKCGLALEALGWTEDAEVAEIEVAGPPAGDPGGASTKRPAAAGCCPALSRRPPRHA